MTDPEPNDTSPQDSREEIIRRAGPFMGIGATFVASIAVCVGGGWWLDRSFGSSPWLTVVGALSGIALGFYLFFKTVASAGGGDHGEWSE